MKFNKIYVYIGDEIFKDITYPGVIQGIYKIGNLGTVIDIQRNIICNQSNDKDGYKQVNIRRYLFNDGIIRSNKLRVHRLVAWEFCEGRDINLVVNHKDTIVDNNIYCNLEWVTVLENNRYKHVTGTRLTGTSHGKCKYTEETIHFICKELEKGLMPTKIARSIVSKNAHFEFRKMKHTIENVKAKTNWTVISKNYNF